MIVELVGPPGVGKSTFTRALTDLLGERGLAVEPVLSDRPAERVPASGRRWMPAADAAVVASLRRLARPMTAMLAGAGLSGRSADSARIAELLRLLPPKSVMWRIRLRQYLFRLCRSWEIAAASSRIVLFDQAFVQALCSLVVLARAAEPARIGQAMDLLPSADLLIRLKAPREVLAARLDQRRHSQGRLERLFELDLPTNLSFGDVIDGLHPLLLARGHAMVSVDSADLPGLQNGVAQAAAEIAAKREAILARRASAARPFSAAGAQLGEAAPDPGNIAHAVGQGEPA